MSDSVLRAVAARIKANSDSLTNVSEKTLELIDAISQLNVEKCREILTSHGSDVDIRCRVKMETIKDVTLTKSRSSRYASNSELRYETVTPIHLAVELAVNYDAIVMKDENNNDSDSVIPPSERRARCIEIIQLLLEHKAEVDEQTSLPEAWTYGIAQKVHNTPLHIAMRGEDEDICKILLAKLPTMGLQDVLGHTCLDVAAAKTDDRFLKLLLGPSNPQNLQDPIKYFALSVAIEAGSTANCRTLIESLKNKNLSLEVTQLAFFEKAVQIGIAEIVDLLAEYKLHEDTKQFPLHTAARLHLTEILKHLLEKKYSSIDSTDSFGCNAFHIACRHGAPTDTLQVLLDFGINTTETDQEGNSPILWAVSSGTVETIQFVLKNAATGINEVNSKGSTPLCALFTKSIDRNKKVELFNMMLEAGLEPSKSPEVLRKAVEHTQPELLEILLSKFKLNPLEGVADWTSPLDQCLRNCTSNWWMQEEQLGQQIKMVDILFHYGGIFPQIKDRIKGNPKEVKKLVKGKQAMLYTSGIASQRAVFYANNWPTLRLLWIAFLKGNFARDPKTEKVSTVQALAQRLDILNLMDTTSKPILNFKQLPWPLFVHILTYVADRKLWNAATPPSIVLSPQ